ncbi:MAG: DUF2169 domain-containing protein [Planctomycetota bacterium]
MPNLLNLTRYCVNDLPSLTKDGRRVLMICALARFTLPKAGKPSTVPPTPTAEPPAPMFEDVYHGEPGASSLQYEGQSTYFRPGTDIYLTGSAWAPKRRRVESSLVDVRVGPCRKQVRVFGDRTWQRGLLGGAKLSAPEPFESIPLVYERAFGGAIPRAEGKKPKWEPRNPVGCGMYESASQAAGHPAPNLEDPNDLIASFGDRPAPQGFGPIARSWQPRVKFAGTYDEAWVNERAPLWPTDFDEQFFCAAAPGLTTPSHLVGGEPVALVGVSPDGAYEFSLPRLRLFAKARFRDRAERQPMTLDAVHFEPDAQTFTMIFRTVFGVGDGLQYHTTTIVRELEVWELEETKATRR